MRGIYTFGFSFAICLQYWLMSPKAVQAENLHKSYLLGATAVGALRGVDLTVRRGEFVALMGPSGAARRRC